MYLIWNSIRKIDQTPSWTHTVWSSYVVPKSAFFFWLAIQNRLLTKDRMRRFGMLVDEMCLLCRNVNENSPHLFTTCRYSTFIFNACSVNLTLNWQDYTLGRFCANVIDKVHEQVAYLYIATTIYHLWQEQNARVHHPEKRRTEKQMVQIIKREMWEKLFTCKSFKRAVHRDRALVLLLY